MPIRKICFMSVFVFGFFLFFGSKAEAQVPPSGSQDEAFQTEIRNDAKAVLDVMNAPFAKSLGFFSTLGWSTPPTVFDLAKGPHFEIGAGLGADLINLPNLNNLSSSTTFLSPAGTLNIPTLLPIPFPVATGRVGLFSGLDIGLRFAYIPHIDIPDIGFATDLLGYGVDVRFKLVDEEVAPKVTVGLSYDAMHGNVSVSTDVNQSGFYGIPSSPATVTGTAVYALNWDIQSFGARVMVGKDLGIFYPFASVGFQRNSGTVSSSMSGLTTHLSPAAGDDTDYPLPAVVSSAHPVVLEPKFVLGIDLGTGFHWATVGESNGTDIAVNTNFRAQF